MHAGETVVLGIYIFDVNNQSARFSNDFVINLQNDDATISQNIQKGEYSIGVFLQAFPKEKDLKFIDISFSISPQISKIVRFDILPCPYSYSLQESERGFTCVYVPLNIIIPTAIFGLISILLTLGFSFFGIFIIIKKLNKLRKQEKAESEMDKKLNNKDLIFGDTTETSSLIPKSVNSKSEKNQYIIPISEIEIIKKIGEGGAGTVYYALWNRADVAIKQLKSEADEEEFEKESILMSSLRHPSIVSCYGVSITSTAKYLVVEYMEHGSLEKALYASRQGREILRFNTKLNILIDIAKGMTYLHTIKPHKIIHRDLKSANVLLDRNMKAKVGDFGLSKVTSEVSTMTVPIGTLWYCSPEIFSNEHYKGQSTKLDVYSFSIIMWELLFEMAPYSNEVDSLQNSFAILMKVAKGHRPTLLFGNTFETVPEDWISHNFSKQQLKTIEISKILRILTEYPVEYKIETLTSPDAPFYLSLNGYQSILDPDLIYFSSAHKLFEFNQRSGKLSILVGCADRVFLPCSGPFYFQQSPFASLPANLSDIYWQTFYLDERENTFYMASYFQIYKFKDGLITLLSDKDYNRNSNVKDGKLLKEAIFRQVTSITMDNEKNLYICDGTTIFKVGQDGILRQLTATGGNTFQKHDGYANNTSLVNIEFITHRNGFLYGYDVFTIFKINLETSWLTIISGKSLINNDTGYAVDYSVHAKGLSFLPDDSILTLDGEYFKMINQTTGKLYTLFKLENLLIFGQIVIGNDLLINNNKILKFDWMTGKVFPIFNEQGSVGDGMLVEYRRFKSISAIAYNQTSGELFVADSTSENTIQKIDTLGRVIHIPLSFSNISCWNSSIKAGIDISYNPVALQVRDSNLFLANTGIHSSIEKIDFSKEGSNCFYAGSIGSNRLLPISEPLSTILNSPNGIHCSKAFTEIYIADTENHRILKYINTKTVEVIAGNSVQGFSGDGGLAVNSQLDRPHSVYYEGSTRILYIADSGNNRIRYIQMDTGIISTLIGNGIPGFNGDELDPLETTLNFPKYVLNSPSLGLLISDSNNHRVRCFNNSVIKTILGTGNSGFKIVVNNPKSSEISSPFGLFLDSSKLYIADSFNHRILLLSIDLQGVPNFVSIIAGTNSPGYNGDGMNPIQAKLFLPSSVHLSSRGIIIGDYMNNRIRLIFNGIISTLEVSNQPAKIQLPTGVCSLKDDILVSSENEILQISSNDIKTTVGGLGDGLHVLNANVNPSKIIFYPDNRMLISESNSNRIRLVDSYGKISTIAGNGKFGYGGDSRMAVAATLASPNGISFSPDYKIVYIADSSNNRIRKLVSNVIHLVAGTGDFGDTSISTDPLKSQFKNPRLLTTLTNGDIVIGDTLNSQIRIISYKDGTIRTIAYSIPATDMISTFNNTIYISTNEQILKVIPICENGFQLVRNNTECVPICDGKVENDACSRRGECVSPDNCKCWDGLFTGKYCEIPICFRVAATDSSVCSNANGTCGLNNKCQCRDGFTGDNCENPICFSQGIGDACGGTLRGTCINKDKCLCNEYFTGERCGLRMCSGKGENDAQVCNGHGKCLENGRCECNTLYSGLDCSDISQIYGLSIAGAIIVLILIVSALVSGILGLVVYRNNKKDRKILETDLFLDERLLASSDEHELSLSNSSTHTALATEDPSAFVIPLHKIGMDKPIKRLGSGGMGSVFMTKFNGMTVAVKVFDLNNLNISEEDFKNEAIVLSKLRHPNIINFYGISTSPTKRYIVMECLDQSLENVITKMEKQQTSYLLDQKLRMMLNIANGIEYLHTLKPRRIIHRDLKTANILLDSNGNCKVCDFGLSKSISQATVSALTNQLGTHYYMSPELFDIKPIDPSYATSVDIYSFSIIMWQILFEIKDPYLSKSPEILKKLGMTSTDPHEQITSYQLTKMICEKNHRPVIPFTSINSCRGWCSEYMPPSKQDESLPIFTLSQLIQQCWQTDPKLRPNIEQVIQQLESILSSLQ